MHKSAMQMQAQDVHNRGGGGVGVAAGLSLQPANSNGSKCLLHLLLMLQLNSPLAETYPDHSFLVFKFKVDNFQSGANCGNGNDVKPHQCQQCLKSFSSNHQLVQHIRVHTGEKPYKCSYCDRRFKQLSHVQQHTRLHTGKWTRERQRDSFPSTPL